MFVIGWLSDVSPEQITAGLYGPLHIHNEQKEMVVEQSVIQFDPLGPNEIKHIIVVRFMCDRRFLYSSTVWRNTVNDSISQHDYVS